MAALITKLLLVFFFFYLFVPLHAKNNLLSCDNKNHHLSQFYSCTKSDSQKCSTFAVLLTNSYYSSLHNLTSYLGLNQFTIAQANGFSVNTEFLPKDQPLLIPIDCKCSADRVFHAELTKTAVQGENFDGISESLEGLTTCNAIKEKNPSVLPQNLRDKTRVLVPVKCACPTSADISSGTKFLISYPVSSGVSVSSLAKQFNVTPQSILKANHKASEREISADSLSVLIPVSQKPLLGSLSKPKQPSFGFPQRSIQGAQKKKKKKKKKAKMKKLALCFVAVGAVLGVIVIAVVAFVMTRKQKKQPPLADAELQQLSLSIRATSEKKVSFEGSQSTLDGQVIEATTPRSCKIMLESYTLEEVQKATEDFNSQNLIEDSVYHGRLKGKNVAIKCTTSDFLSKVEFFLQDAIHTHPSIMRVLGSCVTDGPDSYLVFEYAKNGSLKDWIHGGLAMKSQFIASCSCFLTWRQRIKICLDVALALQYMHHIMHPIYVHRNIKSRNIFLDEEFSAKVGNFGMARCVEDDTKDKNPTDQFNSRNPSSWTKGYLAPECIKQGIFSPSSDIYSYGVVLLEVLSGKTPVLRSDDKDGKEIVMLTEQIKSILGSENVDELREWMDRDLGDNYSFDGAITLANLARSCTEDDPSSRPTAGDIVERLSRLVEESSVEGEQQFLSSESSCKPLVQAAASTENV